MSVPHGNEPASGGQIIRGIPDSDLAIILVGAIVVGPAIALAFMATKWSEFVSWCVDHHILASTAADPIVTLPFSAGAGLDLGRILLAAGLLAALSVGAVWTRNAARRALYERQARRGRRA